MKCIFSVLLFALLSAGSFAQTAHFTKFGVIEYEKTINMHARFKKLMENQLRGNLATMYSDYMRDKPQFRKLQSSLTFSETGSVFVPVAGKTDQMDDPMVGQPNTVVTDLATGTKSSQKKIYEEMFLVKDSVRRIDWKITDEFREIAGYSCRRANAVIMDSVYVVAFYTDEIPVSGGPESFAGLPGMILGVALPHENITWFATRVMEIPVAQASLAPPLKGKEFTIQQLQDKLGSRFSEKGYYFGQEIKAFTL